MKTKTSVLTVVLVLMAFIVAIVVLCSTVFCVSSIKVVWHTSTIALTGQDDNMIQKSGLTTGQSVFLVGKDESVQKLESSYPYVKVLGIETVFPSTLNIHLQEREILYVIQISSSSYAFVDQDFKVLEIKNGVYDVNSKKAILLSGDFKLENVTVSQFLFLEKYDAFKTLQLNFERMDFNIVLLKAFIKQASLGNDRIILDTYLGVQIQIFSPEIRQQEKVAMVLKVFDSLDKSNQTKGIIGVFENNENQICGSHYSYT